MLKEALQTNTRSAWLISPHAAGDLIDRWGAMLSTPDLIQRASEKPEPSEKEDQQILSNTLIKGIVAGTGYNLVGTYQLRYGKVPENSIAVIPVEGVLMKYDSCGYYGTQSIAEMISAAAANSNVIGTIAMFDSPGGNVAGVRKASDAIVAAREKKPIIAFVDDGDCASGAYWLASQCHEIISSHETNTIGSIGVMIGIRDSRKRDKALGIEDILIYADGSENKHSEFRIAMDGDVSLVKQKMLNPIREQFVTAIKSNRGSKIKTSPEDPFLGGIFGDSTSIKLGLVDSIGDFLAAVRAVDRRASLFSKSKHSPSNKPNSLNPDEMKIKLIVGKHDALISAMGLKAADGQTEFEVDAADVMAAQQKANADHFSAFTKSISDVVGSVKTLSDSVKAVSDSVKTTSDNLATATQSITDLKTEVSTLAEGAGIVRKSKAEKGSGAETDDDDKRPKGRLFVKRR